MLCKAPTQNGAARAQVKLVWESGVVSRLSEGGGGRVGTMIKLVSVFGQHSLSKLFFVYCVVENIRPSRWHENFAMMT